VGAAMDDEKRANFSTSVRSVLKQRKTGVERLTWEDERRRRQKWSSEQCLAILKLVDKLLRTTGTMCDVRFFPETGNIMLHTSGDRFARVYTPAHRPNKCTPAPPTPQHTHTPPRQSVVRRVAAGVCCRH